MMGKDSKTVVFILAAGLLYLALVQGEKDESLCKTSDSQGKTIPPLPQSYEAYFQIINRKMKTIKFVTEVYDGNNTRGSLTTYFNGAQNRIIYNDGAGQIVTKIEGMNYNNFLEQNQCKTSKLRSSSDNMFLSYMETTTKQERTIRIDGLFHYDFSPTLSYFGPTKVRNLGAESWGTCPYWPELDATFQVQVYWSDGSSMSPTGSASVPLRIEITGKYKPESSKNYEMVDEVYDIVWFKADPNPTDEMFQPPLGLYCTDDKIKKDFPKMGEAFTMDIEYVFDHLNDPGQSIYYQNLWFNSDTNLLRLDFDEPSPAEAAKFNSNHLTAVRDYKIGVQYTMDQDGTVCIASALQKAPTVDSLFFEKINNYEYLGKYTIRDVLCDVWVGTDGDGITVEWAFLDENWNEEEEGKVEKRVPVQSTWFQWIDHNSTHGARNYFSFRRDPAIDYSSFDISPCFTNAQKKHFQLHFEVDNPDSVNLEELKRIARTTIPNLVHVSALRVDQVETEYKESTNLIYLEFTLLDRPNVPGDKLPSSEDDVSLDGAINLLNTLVQGNGFALSVSLPNSPEVRPLFAVPDSLHELEGPRGPCGAPPAASSPLHNLPEAIHTYLARGPSNSDAGNPIPSTESAMDKYNAGQLAGLAVGMFILGGTLGIIAMLLLLLHIDRSRGSQDGLRLCGDRENAGAASPQDFSPVTETSVD